MMDLGSIVNQGLIGMQKSQISMAQSAQQVAQVGTNYQADTRRELPAQGLAEPLINLMVQSQIFDSSARVVKSADETIGTLLDTKA